MNKILKVDTSRIKPCGDMICTSYAQRGEQSPVCLSSVKDKDKVLLIELQREILATLNSKSDRDLLLLSLLDVNQKMIDRIEELEKIIKETKK